MEGDKQALDASQFVVEKNLRLAVTVNIQAGLFERSLLYSNAVAVAIIFKIVLSKNFNVPLRRGVVEQQISTHGDLAPSGAAAGPLMFR